MKTVLLLALLLSACSPEKGDRGETVVGAPGASIIGPVGETGEVGPTGPAGNDASPATIIKLCPGVTTYPSTFVEVAICLQGKLYGVYSANGGFLTELPPGTYSSNAIGSACNLKVKPACEVEVL